MTSRDRAIVGVVVVLAVVLGGWFLVVQPKRSQASNLQTQINSEQSSLQTEQAAVASGLAAKASYSSFYTELARLGEAVPADVDTPSLIYQVQAAATASGVNFVSLSLGAAPGSSSSTVATPASAATGATGGGLASQPISFTFTGSFFRVANFLGRLERFVTATNKQLAVSGRLMTLNSLSITAGPTGFPAITAAITATSYLLPAGSSSTSSASATTTPVSNPSSSSSSLATPATISAPIR